ncbi:hypothetical protein [Planococcus lenghuensis]|nr:hypothetical protein [Planococcus lenghuensis]
MRRLSFGRLTDVDLPRTVKIYLVKEILGGWLGRPEKRGLMV